MTGVGVGYLKVVSVYLHMVEYCFTSLQLIYDYVEADYDNDDEIDSNSDLHLFYAITK